MQQPSPSKDPPSPQSSSQHNPIETQQNGPPTPISGVDTPSPQMQQPMGLRPGGGPMHMGPPPMGIPPQYRGMMPPYVSNKFLISDRGSDLRGKIYCSPIVMAVILLGFLGSYLFPYIWEKISKNLGKKSQKYTKLGK